MMFIYPNDEREPDAVPTADQVAAMTRYNEELDKAGILLALDGLHPPSRGARVSFVDGRGTVTNAPLTEVKDVIGGYWLIQAKSRQEAIEWALRCPADDGSVIEVRQVFDMSDFPPDIQRAAQ
jgi:hypothetical protein